MRAAYLETFAGISGDMFLGALVDAGAPVGVLQRTLDSLQLGLRLEFQPVQRCGIAATKAHVRDDTGLEEPVPVMVSATNVHRHQHELSHLGDHGADHHHWDDQGDKTSNMSDHHGRSLIEILRLLQSAPLSINVKALATRTFQVLGEAEAKVHGLPLDQVHFHEVGALDAIGDIVLTATAVCELQIDQWFCSPLNVGSGMVRCAHGVYPVPAPAVAELLRKAPTYSTDTQAELVTPTGAALLMALNAQFVSVQPRLNLTTVGYGAGSRDPVDYPNVLRVRLGEQPFVSDTAAKEMIVVLETAIDDMSPQVVAYVAEKLLATGALDVMCTPVLMKKGRQGTLITVLAERTTVRDLEMLLFRETSTLGIRRREEQRSILPREFVNVPTVWGTVRVKIASLGEDVSNIAPEYEDCRRLAESCGVPIKQVQEAALQAYRGMHS
jgi:pyridinium-3,5-bisthiocarboxylic acid mononucleotide nickel chelatase